MAAGADPALRTAVLRQQQQAGQLRRLWIGLRLGWEFAAPLTLIVGARLLLAMLGAQSWAEGLSLFPDFGAWLWAISLIMLLAGATRLVLLRRVLGRRWHAQAGALGGARTPVAE